jgi:hypothetical protein
MIEYGHFIGGKHVAGKSGRTADVFQPMDGTVRAMSRSPVRPRFAPRWRKLRLLKAPGRQSIRSAVRAC